MTPNQLIEALKHLPPEVMDRPIMDGDDSMEPGWSLIPAEIHIEPRVFYASGDVGVIPDPEEDLKAAIEGWGYPMPPERRAVLMSIAED